METRQGRLCSRPPGSEGRGGGASDLTQKLSLPWDPSEGRKPLTPPRSRPSSEGDALLTTPPPMVSFSSCPRTSLSRAGPREVRSGTQGHRTGKGPGSASPTVGRGTLPGVKSRGRFTDHCALGDRRLQPMDAHGGEAAELSWVDSGGISPGRALGAGCVTLEAQGGSGR